MTRTLIHRGGPSSEKKTPERKTMGNISIYITAWKASIDRMLVSGRMPREPMESASRNISGSNAAIFPDNTETR